MSLSESGNILESMWRLLDGAQMLPCTDKRNAACTRQNSRRGNDLINDYPEGMRAVQDRSITHHSKAGGRHRKRRNVEAAEENSRKRPRSEKEKFEAPLGGGSAALTSIRRELAKGAKQASILTSATSKHFDKRQEQKASFDKRQSTM